MGSHMQGRAKEPIGGVWHTLAVQGKLEDTRHQCSTLTKATETKA